MRSVLLTVVISAVIVTTGCGSDDELSLDPASKFQSLEDLLDHASVQRAIDALPAGPGVARGDYYDGDSPDDITGTWTTHCCGGKNGRWPFGGFGGTLTYRTIDDAHVDLERAEGDNEVADGTGSFIRGDGDRVTVFLQLSITCKEDGERVRAVAIDRFTREAEALTNYVRSYVVVAREKDDRPWECFTDQVGSGAASTPAVYALTDE